MRMSMSTTSGRVRATTSTASAPSAASPTVVRSGAESTSTVNAPRTNA